MDNPQDYSRSLISFIVLNLVVRSGGHLPTRITYRLSGVQKRNNETTLEDVKSLFKGDDQFLFLNSLWDKSLICEDCYSGEKTKSRIMHSDNSLNYKFL